MRNLNSDSVSENRGEEKGKKGQIYSFAKGYAKKIRQIYPSLYFGRDFNL